MNVKPVRVTVEPRAWLRFTEHKLGVKEKSRVPDKAKPVHVTLEPRPWIVFKEHKLGSRR